MIINGEEISAQEQQQLLDMFWHDAEQFAGEFYEMERSEKFRLIWPNQDKFARDERKNFVAAVRLLYTKRLGDPLTPESDKQRMFKAIILMANQQQQNNERGIEADNRLQIMPNTQNFVGDKAENRKTMDRFGKTLSYRAKKRQLLNSIAGEIEKL